MSTDAKLSVEQAIHLLTELCPHNQNQGTQLKNQIDQLNDNSVKTTLMLEEIMAKLSTLEARVNTKEVNQANIQMIDEKNNDSLSRSHFLFDHTHQSHYDENVSPMIKNVAAAPLSTHAIIIPSSSTIPTFSGKHSERPKQFLVRIQEYAETVHGWNRYTLLLGISHFLRDAALD
ncbi:unnamed protein product [Adineta steineri]|uniref:Uncharacterized protein n=1 Tax=Adineta steineri TaxID=433720 RepID=A0A814WQZ8_9BILA|nr:unnamed protein product [Adineta steineri]CAF1607272.1 unnamed protein product [Adineta steineri]